MAADDPLKHAMRLWEAGHGQCACKGSSCHPQAQSVGEIWTTGYLIGKRIVCHACAQKHSRGEKK